MRCASEPVGIEIGAPPEGRRAAGMTVAIGLERATGVEPVPRPWRGCALPLSCTCRPEIPDANNLAPVP